MSHDVRCKLVHDKMDSSSTTVLILVDLQTDSNEIKANKNRSICLPLFSISRKQQMEKTVQGALPFVTDGTLHLHLQSKCKYHSQWRI